MNTLSMGYMTHRLASQHSRLPMVHQKMPALGADKPQFRGDGVKSIKKEMDQLRELYPHASETELHQAATASVQALQKD